MKKQSPAGDRVLVDGCFRVDQAWPELRNGRMGGAADCVAGTIARSYRLSFRLRDPCRVKIMQELLDNPAEWL
jgi:hypothetical protein